MKVAIVGTCPSSRMLAQELPLDWKIWVCGPDNVARFSRIDLWFEIHGDLDHGWADQARMFEPYITWLNLQKFPVFAQDNRLIQRAMTFPAERLVKEFGLYFFSSTPAWMMAYAMQEGATDIALFGMDLAAVSEYHRQKPGILHFAWLCEQRGIRVMAPQESEVLQPPPLYGYEFNSPMGRKLRVRELEVKAQVNDIDRQLEHLHAKRQHFVGVLDDLDWTAQTWTGGLYKEQGELIRLEPQQKTETSE